MVFIGENAGYYGPAGLAVENQLLADLGAKMTNQGRCAVPSGTFATVVQPHQLFDGGITRIGMACVSPMTPGPNDFPLLKDGAGLIVGALAKIDLTPLP